MVRARLSGERMSARPSHFRQADLSRAVKALEAAGKEVLRVEIEGGKVVIVTSSREPIPEDVKEWDGVLG